MRRTGDGIDPLEVADGGKKFARPNIQEFLFLFGGWKKSCATSISLHLLMQLMHNLYPRTLKLNVERHVNRWCRISVTRTNPF